nr:hypothetical protein Iba_chr10aCG10330 [Ipomoea batatas]
MCNTERRRRGFTSNAYCGICRDKDEDIDHVFHGTTEEGGWGPLVAEPRQIMLLEGEYGIINYALGCYGDSDAYKNLSFDNLETYVFLGLNKMEEKDYNLRTEKLSKLYANWV